MAKRDSRIHPGKRHPITVSASAGQRITPRMHHMPMPMRHRKDEESFGRVGDFMWRIDPAGRVLVLAIPHTNRLGYVLSEWTIGHKNHNDAQWEWDGNEKKPTLKPSLHAVGIWHGFVREGVLVEA